MRWRRRHRTGSGSPSGRSGGRSGKPGPRPGPSLADRLRSSGQPTGLAPATIGWDVTPWPNQPWQLLHAIADRSGVWISSARTLGDPPANHGPASSPSSPRSIRTTTGHQPAEPVTTTRPAATTARSDGDLIRAAQADHIAFAAVYERYVDAIYRYCVTRVGTPADAEDATSQTFVRAFGALPTYRPRADLPGDGVRSWLFTIAHNVVVSGYRQRRPTSPLIDAEELVDPDPTPDEQAIAAERREVLRASVAHLPDDQRRVVELRLGGLSGPEIAAVLGRSHGAIKMLQFRAIDRLRDLLADRLGAEPATEVSDDQR